VVIPAWNERDNLELLLPALKKVLSDLNVRSEIVVVDGGSRDGTAEAARQWGARVVTQSEPGYGGALMMGFSVTTAPYVITMDADLSHLPVFIEQLWKRRHEAQVLIASRYIPGGRADMTLTRRLLSRILNVTYGRVLSVKVRDLSSGFRLYRGEALRGLRLLARDFDILEEIVIWIYNTGWTVLEVPFQYMARGSGRSHVRLLKFGRAFARTLFKMWRLRNSVEAADYDYRAFDSPIWLQRYWQRTRHPIIMEFVEERRPLLDIGCGSSRIILDLDGAVGFDIAQHKLRWLRSRHDPLVGGSCEDLPFRDKSFATVINSEVIEHVRDVPEVLTEMDRVLRPGGILIVGTPDYDRWLWHVLEWIYGKVLPGAYAHEHITHFTQKTLAARLRAAGYEILACRYVGFCEMIFKARKPLTPSRSPAPV
jgi:dolichol-phosphate mannosyltransferase